jgi:ankyrin repeat protein
LDVNRENNGGLTPLHLASVRGKLEAVHELLRLGANASMSVVADTGDICITPLHQAVINGHKEIVSVLLDAGCPIDIVNIEGRSALGTPLHQAALKGSVLLDAGCPIDLM